MTILLRGNNSWHPKRPIAKSTVLGLQMRLNSYQGWAHYSIWKNPSYVTSNWKNTPCISHLLLFGKLLKQVEHHGRGLRPAYIVYVPPLYKHCDAYMDVQCTYCLCRVVLIIGLSHPETKNSRKKLPFLCNSPDLGYCCSWYSQDNWSLSVNCKC